MIVIHSLISEKHAINQQIDNIRVSIIKFF